MTTPQRIARRLGGTDRRRVRWFDTLLNVSVVSGSEFISSIDGAGSDFEEATLTRLILCYTILPTTPIQNSVDAQLFSMGIGVTSREAFAATATPDPNNDAEQPVLPWLYKCRHWILECSGVNTAPLVVDRDLRSQRKIGQGRAFVIVQNDPGAGTPYTARIVMLIRALYMLP